MTMRAVVMRQGKLSLTEAEIPKPGPGEVLVKTLACGICGSDVHCITHGAKLLENTRAIAGIDLFSLDDPVVLGHEICAEVVEHGPDCRRDLKAGARAVSPPFLLRPQLVTLGFGGPETPGGYAEYMVLSEALMLPVPDDLPSDVATLVEPLAVATHAVNRGAPGADDVPLVIGCGPIGLAIIAVLKLRGLGPIVAADFSPSRRALALKMGADVVVDPRETSPYDSWKEMAATSDPARLGRQTSMFAGYPHRPSIIFECVGVPGVIQQVLAGAAPCSKVVVAGLCMEPDTFSPTFAIMKEVDLTFCMAFTVEEFGEAFDNLARGRFDVGALITSHVGLDGVEDAIVRLADPERDAKIIIVP